MAIEKGSAYRSASGDMVRI